jgi:hypothetical protein
VLPGEVECDREEQRACPRIHGIEVEAFCIADQIGDEPDDEPEECHDPTVIVAHSVRIGTSPQSMSGVTPIRLVRRCGTLAV